MTAVPAGTWKAHRAATARAGALSPAGGDRTAVWSRAVPGGAR
jgi:hypothetical protein